MRQLSRGQERRAVSVYVRVLNFPNGWNVAIQKYGYLHARAI